MSICSSPPSTHGAHPKVQINLTVPELSPNCELHLLFTLPPLVFIDKFEFPYRHTLWGHQDLELPVHALKDQNNAYVLVYLQLHLEASEEVHLEVPLHLRYAEPRPGGGYEDVAMDWPLFFSACPRPTASSEPDLPLLNLPSPFVSPFDESITSLSFYPPCGPAEDPSYKFTLPVGNVDHLSLVQYGTVFLVLACFFWTGIELLKASKRLSASRPPNSIRDKTE